MQGSTEILSTALKMHNEQNRAKIIQKINELLQTNPSKVKWLLYRFDVDEEKLKKELATTEESEAVVITTALISRINQILITRNKFSSGNLSDGF